jgi:hypothetical protein
LDKRLPEKPSKAKNWPSKAVNIKKNVLKAFKGQTTGLQRLSIFYLAFIRDVVANCELVLSLFTPSLYIVQYCKDAG